MKWLKKHFITLIIIVALLAGLGLLLYPSIADSWNRSHQSRAIMSYADAVADMDKEEYEKYLSAAYAYNRRLADTGLNWDMSDAELEEYDSLLNVSQTGIMGYITIEVIGVNLPIYHGTSEDVLQKSIGHLDGTSLPVGAESFDEEQRTITDPEEGVHSVVSGHRGLPSAKLFSDLDELVTGDIFTITVLNETYTYQVDQITVTEPNDLSKLVVEKGKDYCTLVTCTPYGINTHRLLVRGHRVPDVPKDEMPAQRRDPNARVYIAVIMSVLILLILLIFLIIRKMKGKK